MNSGDACDEGNKSSQDRAASFDGFNTPTLGKRKKRLDSMRGDLISALPCDGDGKSQSEKQRRRKDRARLMILPFSVLSPFFSFFLFSFLFFSPSVPSIHGSEEDQDIPS